MSDDPVRIVQHKRAMGAQAHRYNEQIDRAKGGYYTVQDLRAHKRGKADFYVRGYDMYGNLLLQTWHIGESSMQTECMAWESRGATKRDFDPVRELR